MNDSTLNKITKPYFIFVHGPTGVGKTDVAIALAQRFPKAHIINADVGQFYVPFTIGTAKPLWQEEATAHHLFDIIDEPRDLTVLEYRNRVVDLMSQMWQQGIVPIIVGGSGFYLKSLIFPPHVHEKNDLTHNKQIVEIPQDPKLLWKTLAAIDPERAAQLHLNDTYRITRALELWNTTGKKPSLLQPIFNPPAPFVAVHLTRNRDELYERINSRVIAMLKQGWVDEVRSIKDTPWKSFIEKKKLIGYDDILTYLTTHQDQNDLDVLVATIQQKTRNYAKRQETFWNHLEQAIDQQGKTSNLNFATLSLTLSGVDLYIDELYKKITEHIQTTISETISDK